MTLTPYFEREGVQLFHGDCREILPLVAADVLVTDPPFGIAFRSGWTGAEIVNDESTAARDRVLAQWGERPAIVFGSFAEPAPAGTRARLVWHRPGSGMGDLDMPWKPDFEAIYVLGSGFNASKRGSGVLVFPWDTFRGDAGHPHRKPEALMRHLIERCPAGVIVDTFMGSGSTIVAARDLGRRAIGIEIEERYCELAAMRLQQPVLDFEPQPAAPTIEQGTFA